jgi:hypothetical protein
MDEFRTTPKPPKAFATVKEAPVAVTRKVTALPGLDDLQALHKQYTTRPLSAAKALSYSRAQEAAYRAKTRMARIALEVVNPGLFEELLNRERNRIQEVMDETNKACLGHFSEDCTSGL